MIEWYIDRRVILHELEGAAYLARQSYQLFVDGDFYGELEMFVLETDVLTEVVMGLDFEAYGCKGFGGMMKDVFEGMKWMNMIRYQSGRTGKLKNVQRIYWVESMDFITVDILEFMIRDIVITLQDRIYAEQGVLIMGFYPGVMNLFPVLDELGFRDVVELDRRFYSRSRTGWDVRYEMFFSE